MKNLTRKQVLALSRALKRKGRKLPKLGWCTTHRTPSGKIEICHDYSATSKKHVYYMVGGGTRQDARRERRYYKSRPR